MLTPNQNHNQLSVGSKSTRLTTEEIELNSTNVCSAAILNMVDSAFILIDNRLVWLPQYTVKFQQHQNAEEI